MKRTSPLWGSISILIGVVIAILSLLRGIWATVALLTAFAVWGLGSFSPSFSPPGGPTAHTGVVSGSPMTGRKLYRVYLCLYA